MRAYIGSTAMQRNLALAIPLVAAAWLISVPTVVTTWNFLTFVGLLTAFGWVARTTYHNGQPAPGLAALLHDTEHSGSREHPRDNT